MDAIKEATFRWASTLVLAAMLVPMNMIGVWVARRNALDVNGIELTHWWYLFALFGPILSLVVTISVPRSNWIWSRSLVTNVLFVLMLSSFTHIPVMYSLGGFK